MTLSVGTVEYRLGTEPVTGCGLSWTAEELDAALSGPVVEVVFDDEGTAECAAMLEGLAETEFDREGVKRVLDNKHEPEAWRVGEGIAESYLAHHRGCYFPWPDGRDERKSGSSLPGADLVGFYKDGEMDCFAFGEIKTSSEVKYPPGLTYGIHGFKQQLEDLRDKVSDRDDLVNYLWHRAVTASWKDRFVSVYTRYSADNTNVWLFGLLVRDVEPRNNDLRARVTKLGKDCPTAMSIELLALYLPSGSIDTLSKKVMNSRKGGDA